MLLIFLLNLYVFNYKELINNVIRFSYVFFGAILLYRKLQSRCSMPTKNDKKVFLLVSSSIVILWSLILIVNIDFITGSLNDSFFTVITGYFTPFFAHILIAYLCFTSGWTLKQFPENSKFTFSFKNHTIKPHFSGNKKQLFSAITSLEILLNLMINEEFQHNNTINLMSPLITTKSESLLSTIIKKSTNNLVPAPKN